MSNSFMRVSEELCDTHWRLQKRTLVVIPELGITRIFMGIYSHVETAELRTLALQKNNIKSESNFCKYVT